MNYIQQQNMLMAAPPPAPPVPQQQQQHGPTVAQNQHAHVVLRQDQSFKEDQEKQDLKTRRSRVKEMLEQEKRNTPVVFNGLDDYLAMEAAYKSLLNRDEDDGEQVAMDGYPMTDAERAPLVAQLSAAIMDFSNIVDKPMKRRTSGGQITVPSAAFTAVKHLSTFEVQLLAWKIMCAICDAHCGRHNVPPWTNTWKFNSYITFTARFRDVLHAVATCKALLKSILDTETPFVKRLAAGPKAEVKFKRETQKMYVKKTAETEGIKKRKREDDDEEGQDSEGDHISSK